MDLIPPTQSPQVIIAQKTFPFKKILLIILIIILISAGFGGGYYLGTSKSVSIPKDETPLNTEAMVREKDLPFSLKILKNPMVNQWAAGVEGRLVEKKDDSITRLLLFLLNFLKILNYGRHF